MKITQKHKSVKSSSAVDKKGGPLSPTSQRYKGYLIRLSTDGSGYAIYDANRELEDHGFISIENAKKAIDKLTKSDVKASRSSDNEWQCPHCMNNSLKGIGDGMCICDSCGEEFKVSYDNKRGKWLKERITSSYHPTTLTELVNHYRSLDTMDKSQIWDEVVAEHNDEDLANDVIEALEASEPDPYEDIWSSTDITATDSQLDATVDKILNEVNAKVHEVMGSPEFGYPDDEIEEYTVIESKFNDDNTMLIIEVRAELSYKYLEKLGEACNEVVAKYDPSAYFEPVCPGITDAYLSLDELKKVGLRASTSINSASRGKKPKFWDTRFSQNVINAYNSGELTFDNIREWDRQYNGGVDPKPAFNTAEILKYYIDNQDTITDSSGMLSPDEVTWLNSNIEDICNQTYESYGKGDNFDVIMEHIEDVILDPQYLADHEQSDNLIELAQSKDTKLMAYIKHRIENLSYIWSCTKVTASTEYKDTPDEYIDTVDKYDDATLSRDGNTIIIDCSNSTTLHKICKELGIDSEDIVDTAVTHAAYVTLGKATDIDSLILIGGGTDDVLQLIEDTRNEYPDIDDEELAEMLHARNDDLSTAEWISVIEYLGNSITSASNLGNILSFKCPVCHNNTVHSTEKDIHNVLDIDYKELFVCDECGSEMLAIPQFDNTVKFTVETAPADTDWNTVDPDAINGASYGGAFDILDDQYFTKDDLLSFGENVIGHLNEIYYEVYELSNIELLSGNRLLIEVRQTESGDEFSAQCIIDMRKIKRPSDLKEKYALEVVSYLTQEIDNFYNETKQSIEGASPLNVTRYQGYYIIPDLAGDGYNVFDCERSMVDEGLGTLQDAKDLIDKECERDINAASEPERELDPPEGNSNVKPMEPGDESIEVDLDEDITVLSDGTWEYADESFANSDEPSDDNKWHSEDGVYLDDTIGVIEKIDEIIEPHMPMTPGKYHISGTVTLVYEVSGVYEDVDYFEDSHGNMDYDREVYTDGAESNYNADKSSVEHFEFNKI